MGFRKTTSRFDEFGFCRLFLVFFFSGGSGKYFVLSQEGTPYTVRAENVRLRAEFFARARHPPAAKTKIVQYEIKVCAVDQIIWISVSIFTAPGQLLVIIDYDRFWFCFEIIFWIMYEWSTRVRWKIPPTILNLFSSKLPR